MEKHRLYRSTTRIALLGFAALIGLAFSRRLGAIDGSWPLLFGIFALLSFRNKRILSVYAIILFGLSLGLWRGGQFITEVKYLDSIAHEKVTLVGAACRTAPITTAAK